MSAQTITIDNFYKYQVDEVREGGMGRVFLMSLVDKPRGPNLMTALLDRPAIQDRFRYVYRDRLAAKRVKHDIAVPMFVRECNIWMALEEPGIVPLLKVARVNDMIIALMPRYDASLRALLRVNTTPPAALLKLLRAPVESLAALHRRHGIVHQDIKPENLLYQREVPGPLLALTDWGIANVQASLIPKDMAGVAKLALVTMSGFGTIPYMAPERFTNYISNVGADIYSLGIVFIEIITGDLPYDRTRPLPDQIVSGECFDRAKRMLSAVSRRVSSVVLSMIHPSEGERQTDYRRVLKFIKRF